MLSESRILLSFSLGGGGNVLALAKLMDDDVTVREERCGSSVGIPQA